MAARRSRRKARPARSTVALRWLAIAGVALLAFLYYRPIQSYLHARRTFADRTAEVRSLRAEQHELELRLARTASHASLLRGARQLGLVKPGERLFVVRGIAEWRRAHARPRRR